MKKQLKALMKEHEEAVVKLVESGLTGALLELLAAAEEAAATGITTTVSITTNAPPKPGTPEALEAENLARVLGKRPVHEIDVFVSPGRGKMGFSLTDGDGNIFPGMSVKSIRELTRELKKTTKVAQ